jgi:mannose-6-phosphate isomerase-like protein (cupin superfamily)
MIQRTDEHRCKLDATGAAEPTPRPGRITAMKMLTSAILVVAAAASFAAQTQAPPAAPPSGSAGIYKSSAELTAALKGATEPASGMTTAPIALNEQYRINIVHRAKGASAVAHAGNTELHYIIEGSGTFVSGGTLVRPTQTGALATITGGAERRVSKGDVVVIPENSPHWYKDLDGPITYLEVRWLAPVKE